MDFASIPFVANATPTAGGSPALVQRTSVARGAYSNPTASFSADVTAGNTLVIFAGTHNDSAPSAITVTTSQSDTVVSNIQQIGSSQHRTILGYVASAVGGPTTITLDNEFGHSAIYVEEWENISYDSSAGVGQVAGSLPQTASTPNSSTVADGVSFTVLSAWTGASLATVDVPSGWTEGGRYNGSPGYAGYGQVIGAYRFETATGVKSAAWLDPGSGEFIGAQVFTFSQS